MQSTGPRSGREPRGAADGASAAVPRRSWRRRVLAAVAVSATVLVGAMSAPAAAAPDAPDPGVPGIVWEADTAPDLISAFDRTEYNESSGAPRVVDSPNLPGRRALQFTVPGGGNRSELVPNMDRQKNGQDLFFGYSGKLADDFPVDEDGYQIIMQWHQDADQGSPPVAVHVKRGQLFLAGGGNRGNEGFEQRIGTVKPGQDLNLIVRIKFSQDPSEGKVNVWNNGRQVLRDFEPPDGTAYDDQNYMKVGIYRDSSLESTASLWINNVAVGTDLRAVQDQIGAPTGADPDAGTSADGSEDSSWWSPISMALGALVVVVLGLGVMAWRRRTHQG